MLTQAEYVEAAPEDVGLSSSRLENVTRLVHRYVDSGRYPGVVSMVARRGKVVHFETYGSMDDEAGKPMRPDTVVRLHSMTKPIASIAFMTLYEEARFQLDDPASKYIPEFKGLRVFDGGDEQNYRTREAAREMTVQDLLMHTSGLLQNYNVATPVGVMYQNAGLRALRARGAGGTLKDMIARVSEMPLQCDPGTEWNYGISTDVIGYLCEVISGQPFDRFVQERVLDPLGMTDTGFHVRDLDRFAAEYQRGGAGDPLYVLADAPATSAFAVPQTYFSGAGGLVGTAADYMRFCKMLANGGELDGRRIIGPRTLEFMTMNHLPGGSDLGTLDGKHYAVDARHGIGFGLGFAVLLDPTRAQVLGTPGEYYWGGAASTAFFVSPNEDGLIMIFLTQLRPSSSWPIRRELRQAVYQAIID
jgi:CubicO group peptidase (beta-lactamase class C family)